MLCLINSFLQELPKLKDFTDLIGSDTVECSIFWYNNTCTIKINVLVG